MLEEVPTIKNAVNLRPKTLQVLPRANAPHILDITFVFDATKPCTVTTHVAAMEILRTMELSTPQLPPPRIQFNAGLGQKFQDQTGRHCVNLSLYEEDALQAAQGAVYPLVVRLEVLADGSQGKSLDSLPPGAAQPEWVQSQTTFAELKKGEDGTWSAKVIKQKIWFDGTPYELQEIYGLQSSNDQGGGAADDDNSTECIICMTNDRRGWAAQGCWHARGRACAVDSGPPRLFVLSQGGGVAPLPSHVHVRRVRSDHDVTQQPLDESRQGERRAVCKRGASRLGRESMGCTKHRFHVSRPQCPICRRRVHNFLSIRKTGARGPENV